MRRLYMTAAFVNVIAALNVSFSNCLPRSVISPRFVPTEVSAVLNPTTQTISYQILGNMTGQINDTNADDTLASAVTNTISVAGYTESKTDNRLCNLTHNIFDADAAACPFGPGPVFFAFDTQLNSSFIFSSITSEIRINGPTATNYEVGCIELTITPPFSKTINEILTYIPLAILILVGLKVVLVALANPWSGTIDPYRAFSNFGMDVNALRMLTPGFSDCLMYLQFVAYTSMMYLNYPGFYQLATSRVSWALLLFDESPVSKDLNYVPQEGNSIATYINFVGARRQDAWKSFMIWWVILQVCVIGLESLILSAWWFLTQSSTDLTKKNFPFLGGGVLRVYYWLLVPMCLFTSYQLVTAQRSIAALTALSALIFMVLVVLLPVALVYFLSRHEPRQDLYDDLSILSLFGPLYNTFQEHATLLFVPNVILAVFRGLTIGFLQSYGTAQIVLLTIFEAAYFITLMIWRPWPKSSNTTILNLLLSGFRFVIVLLMVAFIPDLNIASGKREWVGYIILIIHAALLVLGFLGNALFSLLELAIRLLVIVPQDEGARAIFGARQLRSRRQKQPLTEENRNAPNSTSSANSLSGLLNSKESSPFFRTPRTPSRLSSRMGAESSLGDLRSMAGSDGFASPYGDDPSYHYAGKNHPIVRSHSYASEEVLNLATNPDPRTSTRLNSDADMYDLTLAPTEDAARRGVDYAVREADVYHPQSSGELLGPSKKLGTGPADPNGVKFRKINWVPWKKEKNEEKGKFVVVRSSPAPQRPSSVPMQELGASGPDALPKVLQLPSTYETLQEEDGDLAEHDDRDNSEEEEEEEETVRRVVNESVPTLPRLMVPSRGLFSPSPVETSSPTEDHAFLSSPQADHYDALGRDRRASVGSDSSYVSILATPGRPKTGERISSYHSGHTERSVRSNLVRDSYITLDGEIVGETAELVDLEPDR